MVRAGCDWSTEEARGKTVTVFCVRVCPRRDAVMQPGTHGRAVVSISMPSRDTTRTPPHPTKTPIMRSSS